MPGRIFIVDNVSNRRILLDSVLKRAEYETRLFENGLNALQEMKNERPQLVIADIHGADMSGQELCKYIRSSPELSRIPVILTSSSASLQDRLDALEAGADEIFQKPMDELTLLARIRSILRNRNIASELSLKILEPASFNLAEETAHFGSPTQIGIVAGNPIDGRLWKEMLSEFSGSSITALDRKQALTGAPKDVYLITGDVERRDNGLNLLSELLSCPNGKDAVLLMILPSADSQQAALALDIVANDILHKGVSKREISLRIHHHLKLKRTLDTLQKTVAEHSKLAMVDPLTGTYNKRYLQSYLRNLITKSKTQSGTFALMAVDVDHFKQVNDRFGHSVGDSVLREVSRRITEYSRENDVVARVGGDEFLIVSPNIDLPHTHVASERIRRKVEGSPVITLDDGTEIYVTLSMGVSMGGLDATAGYDIENLIRMADVALYAAKDSGRNKVSFARAAA